MFIAILVVLALFNKCLTISKPMLNNCLVSQQFFLHIRTMLATQYPKLSHVILDHDNITLAVNEEYIVGTQALQQGDVVALIPPISGG